MDIGVTSCHNLNDRVPLACSADGISLYGCVTGNGEPAIIFIHGWCCSADFWREQLRALSNLNVRLVACDLAGHGASRTGVTQRSWSIERLAYDVATIADTLAVQEVLLVGHSMGGVVALEAALCLGSRCRLLVGVDTFTDAAFYSRRPASEIAQRRAPFAADFGATMRSMIDRIIAPNADVQLVDWIAHSMADAANVSIALATLEALLSYDIEARWPLLKCAAFTINSEMLAAGTDRLELAALQIRELSGVGHFPMLEAAPAFNRVLRAIIEPALQASRPAAPGASSDNAHA